MGYEYSWDVEVVAKTKARSLEILAEAMDAAIEEDERYDMDYAPEWNTRVEGYHGKWRSAEHKLLEEISKRLEDGELAYGQYYGEDASVGYYYATKEGWKELSQRHPMDAEIRAAQAAQER